MASADHESFDHRRHNPAADQFDAADPPAERMSGPVRRPEPDRYLALAFAWGDILLELDQEGTISFAAGATDILLHRPAHALVGRPLAVVVADETVDSIAAMLDMVRRHGRAERESIALAAAGGRRVTMRAAGYCLSDDGPVYLALRRSQPPPPGARPVLRDGPAFAAAAAAALHELTEKGVPAAVSFVSAPGLDTLAAGLSAEQAMDLETRVEQAVERRAAGGALLKVQPGSYGLVHEAAADLATLSQEISSIAKAFAPEGLACETMTMPDLGAISEEEVAEGVLYAISRFREAQASGITLKDLSRRITTIAGDALGEVRRFKEVCRLGDFEIVFQPIVDLATGQIHHYEALARFSGSNESPQRVIAFAEATGMVAEFDIAVARQAVKALSAYPRNSDRLKLAINVSGHSVGSADYVRPLMALLQENLWIRGKLLFEITESARMRDLSAAAAFIEQLRRWGFQVCLDDFGAGAASFQYLSMLNVDIVKIDGWSIRNARNTAKGKAFLSALTGLCRRLGTKTVAEMIDSEEALHFVRECGCDCAQGYLFGKPHRDLRQFSPLPNAHLLARLPARPAGG